MQNDNMNTYNNLIQLLNTFPDETTCIEHLLDVRWPDGMICPWCASQRRFTRIKRYHRFKCCGCKKEFSVRKGTIFEGSRLPLQKWFLAIWLYSEHRKGISSVQLARDIGVTQKTTWFMLSRLREVFVTTTRDLLAGIVEADETYVGGKEHNKHANRKHEDQYGIAEHVSRFNMGNAPGYARLDTMLVDSVGVRLPYADLIKNV